MSVQHSHPGLRARTVIGLGILLLAGIGIGLGHALLVVVMCFGLGLVAFWKDRLVDLVIAIGMLTISFSGIEIGPVTTPDLFLVPAAMMLGFRHVVSWDKNVPLWLLGSAATIFVAGLLSQVAFGNLPSRSIVILVQLCISLVYVPLVVSLGVRNSSQLRRLSALFVMSAAISASFGLLEFLGITDVASRISGFSGFPYNGGRPAGFTAHPNQLGLVCVLAFPLAMELFRRSRLWASSLLLLVAGVMVSGSRTALAGLVVAAFVMLWIRGTISTTRLVKGTVALALVGAMATAAGVDVTLDRVLSDDNAVAEATEARTDSVRTAVSDIKAHPLTGVGFGGNAHSLYVQILQGAGVFALAGFAWFGQRTLRIARSMRAHPLAGAAGASMMTWLITGLVHPGLYERYLYVPAGIILGARILARKGKESEGATEPAETSTSGASGPTANADSPGAPGQAMPPGTTPASSRLPGARIETSRERRQVRHGHRRLSSSEFS